MLLWLDSLLTLTREPEVASSPLTRGHLLERTVRVGAQAVRRPVLLAIDGDTVQFCVIHAVRPGLHAQEGTNEPLVSLKRTRLCCGRHRLVMVRRHPPGPGICDVEHAVLFCGARGETQNTKHMLPCGDGRSVTRARRRAAWG